MNSSISVRSVGRAVNSTHQRLAISSIDFQHPCASPARYAAPKAVVSCETGRDTLTCKCFACSCSIVFITEAPPSTLRLLIGLPVTSSCSQPHHEFSTIDSMYARAISLRPVPLVIPIKVPLADESHQGLPRPVKAGTKYPAR